jgi:hypothetical protein
MPRRGREEVGTPSPLRTKPALLSDARAPTLLGAESAPRHHSCAFLRSQYQRGSAARRAGKAELDAQAAQRVREALEAGEALDPPPNPRAHPNDAVRLRGIPAIGRGVSGAIGGTDPVRALEHKEGRRRS